MQENTGGCFFLNTCSADCRTRGSAITERPN